MIPLQIKSNNFSKNFTLYPQILQASCELFQSIELSKLSVVIYRYIATATVVEQ